MARPQWMDVRAYEPAQIDWPEDRIALFDDVPLFGGADLSVMNQSSRPPIADIGGDSLNDPVVVVTTYEDLTELRACVVCHSIYVEFENIGRMRCMDHSEPLTANQFYVTNQSVRGFAYPCCQQSEGSPGCTPCDHRSGKQHQSWFAHPTLGRFAWVDQWIAIPRAPSRAEYNRVRDDPDVVMRVVSRA